MKKIAIAAALCSMLFLAGCASTQAVRLDGTQRQATDANRIQVVLDRAQLKRSVKDIGMITVDDGEGAAWGVSDDNKLMAEARKQAAAMGAHGIIVDFGGSSRSFGYGGMSNTAHSRILKAIAFVYE